MEKRVLKKIDGRKQILYSLRPIDPDRTPYELKFSLHNQFRHTGFATDAPVAFSNAGRAMPFIDAVAIGLQDTSSADSNISPKTTAPVQSHSGEENESSLTSREIDVLRLIAAGLTNKEIAERLVVSHRTVEAHLYSVFNKLNVTTRSAATRYAIEHQLGGAPGG